MGNEENGGSHKAKEVETATLARLDLYFAELLSFLGDFLLEFLFELLLVEVSHVKTLLRCPVYASLNVMLTELMQ